MNYSRSTKRKQNLYFRRLVISWLICVVLGFILGFAVRALCFDESSEEPKNYFDNHEAACDFGLQYLDVYKIIESEDENND